MSAHGGWGLLIEGPDYLDGIQSGLMVYRGEGKSPVAYMFDEAEARLVSAAPDLLAVAQLARTLVTGDELRAALDAAIAKATGSDQ